MAKEKIRVALADDHPIVLDGLEGLFRLEKDFQVVARCHDGQEVERVLRSESVDLLILDLRMPGGGGLEVLETIAREQLAVRVLLLTAAIETVDLVRALSLGAHGLVLKDMAAEKAVEAARRIAAGERCFDPAHLGRVAEYLARHDSGGGIEQLTPREREVASMVAHGARNKAIADRLEISEATVKLHLHHVYEKLRLSSRVELVLYAQKHGL